MEHAINEGDVHAVVVHNHRSNGIASIATYIHHELTPERERQLVELVEATIVRAVTVWVQP